MEFRVLNDAEKSQYREELLEILSINDKNFIPPLSQRTSTTQASLQGDAEKSDIAPYFNKMMEQNILAMFVEDKLFGFVSYIDNYVSDVVPSDTHPNIYLSTLALRRAEEWALQKRPIPICFSNAIPSVMYIPVPGLPTAPISIFWAALALEN